MPLARHSAKFLIFGKYINSFCENYADRKREMLLEVHDFGGGDARNDGGGRKQHEQRDE